MKTTKEYQRRWKFNNGYEASVIRNKYSYGHDLGLYEVAIFKDGDIDYSTHITDDVLGYLTPREVVYKLREIEAL